MNTEMFSLAEKFKLVAEQNLSRIILQEEAETGFITYTYADFFKHAQEFAKLLIEFGVKKGDRVALILDNDPRWSFVYFGIMFVAAIAVPLDSHASQKDIFYFLENSESKYAFSISKYFNLFAKIETLSTLQNLFIIDDNTLENIFIQKVVYAEEFIAQQGSDLSPVYIPALPDDIASIVYTSGTTGKPKGVMLTHKNFYANYLSIEKLNFLHGDENILALLPLHHTFPFMTMLIIPLFARLKITYPKNLKSDALLKCMQNAEITALIAVPQLYYLFYESIRKSIREVHWSFRWIIFGVLEMAFYLRKYLRINLGKIIFYKIHRKFGKKMRVFISGGAKLDQKIQEAFFKLGFNLFDGYGLTETAPVVTFNFLKKFKFGSVGQVVPDVEIKIYKPDHNGGEILIKGHNVMRGYYKLSEQTKEVLHDGWFYSGDLGYIDQDGYLYIIGRKNEIIVLSNGKKIAPEELEAIYSQTPYIKELCILVFGSESKERLLAVVYPDFEHFRQHGEINFYGKIKWELENLAQALPPYKHIMGFVLAKEDLPRTHLGKLRRYLVKAKYQAELLGAKPQKILPEFKYSDEDLKILASHTGQKTLAVLTSILGKQKTIRLEDNLELDLGLDSLRRLELMVDLEKALGIKIPESLFGRIYTVRDLISQIKPLLNNHPNAIIFKPGKETIWREIFNSPLPQDVLNKIDLSPSKKVQIATNLFDKFLYALFRSVWHLKIFGQENLPQDRAFIICSNHSSYLDGFIITAAMPKKLRTNLFFLGLLRAPAMKHVQKISRIITIDPAEFLVPAMQAGAFVLRNNKILAIFPEAQRSIDGKVKNFKTGIGILLKETDALAIPVYIDGSFVAWPRTKLLPKSSHISIIFGKPCAKDELVTIGYKMGAKDDYTAMAEGLRQKIIALGMELKKLIAP